MNDVGTWFRLRFGSNSLVFRRYPTPEIAGSGPRTVARRDPDNTSPAEAIEQEFLIKDAS
jgi:hypothetical protein